MTFRAGVTIVARSIENLDCPHAAVEVNRRGARLGFLRLRVRIEPLATKTIEQAFYCLIILEEVEFIIEWTA